MICINSKNENILFIYIYMYIHVNKGKYFKSRTWTYHWTPHTFKAHHFHQFPLLFLNFHHFAIVSLVITVFIRFIDFIITLHHVLIVFLYSFHHSSWFVWSSVIMVSLFLNAFSLFTICSHQLHHFCECL